MRTEFNFEWKNWAGNHSCVSDYFFEAETENEIIDIVKKASALKRKIRVAGSGHSFSPLVLSNDIIISLKKYNQVISTIGNLVTVQSGITLKELYSHLKQNKLSLPNYGVINKQTIAGALATGTHGSGIKYKSLSASIHSMLIIKADGTPLKIDKNSKLKVGKEEISLWEAASISLGLLGIVSEITLECEPLFYLKSEEIVVSFEEYVSKMDEWANEFDYFKAWWFPHTDKVYVYKTKRISNAEYELRDELEKYSKEQKKRDLEIDKELAPLFKQSLKEPLLIPEINGESLDYYFTNRIKYGASMDILVHEETVPMIVSEYGLSMKNDHHKKALMEFKELIEKNHHLHFPVDLRFTAQENSFLSPSYQEPVFYIGMCVREYARKEIPETMQVFIDLMKKYNARPNWGKISDFSKSDFEKHFPGMEKFNLVRKHLDPQNRFMNEKTEEWFG